MKDIKVRTPFVRSIELIAKLKAFRNARNVSVPRVDVVRKTTLVKRIVPVVDRRYEQLMRHRRTHYVPPFIRKFAPKKMYYAEMEDPTQSEANVECSTAGEVTLQHPTPSSNTITGIKLDRSTRFRKLATSDSGKAVALADDWVQISTFEWNQSHEAEVAYWEYELPKALLKYSNLPQIKPFLVHQYANFDMEVMIQTMGMKFLNGLLIASWYYHPELDDNYGRFRRTRHSMVQRPHVFVDASTSNVAKLKIPFISYMQNLQLTSRSDMGPTAQLGSLCITPFNKLIAKTGQNIAMSVTVSIRFIRSVFYGKTSSTIGSRTYDTEMLPMMAMLAAQRLLNQNDPDRNRDKPPYTGGALVQTPLFTSSLAPGKHFVEAVQCLRLDAHGQTPHPECSEDPMSIKNIVQNFGYVKTVKLTTESQPRDYIPEASLEASPMLGLDHYDADTYQGYKTYRLPPVAVVSGLFAKWRGSIKFKFVFVSAMFHQVSLIFGFVPHVLDNISYSDILGCKYEEFVLTPDGPREFVFEAPYLAPYPFWPRRYSTGAKDEEILAPGRIHVFYKTTLQSMESQSNSVYMNIFMSGGEDFEVAVPCQPSIGLAFNAHGYDPIKGSEVRPKTAAYNLNNIDTWRSATASTGPLAVHRYGPGSDHVCQYEDYSGKGPDRKFYYENDVTQIRFPLDFTYSFTIKNSSTKFTTYPKYAIPLDVNDGFGSVYFAVASFEWQLVFIYYDVTVKKDGKLTTYECKLRSSPNYEYCSILVNPSKDLDARTSSLLRWIKVSPLELDCIRLLESHFGTVNSYVSHFSPENDTCESIYRPIHSNSGYDVYGEQFDSFKDLGRRWSPYANTSFFIKAGGSQDLGKMTFIIPVMPAGLMLQAFDSKAQTMIRDGPLPIIASYYRYFRGGLRFKIIAHAPPVIGMTMWAQHRPDRRIRRQFVYPDAVSQTDLIYNHGYASAVTNTGVNSSMVIEVPYYLTSTLGALQRPVLHSAMTDEVFGLGEIYVGMALVSQVPLDLTIPITILWSLADDMTYYTPIGFPPIVMLRDYEKAIKRRRPYESQLKVFYPEMEEASTSAPKEDEVTKEEGPSFDPYPTNINQATSEAMQELFTKEEEVQADKETTITRKIFRYFTGTDLDAIEKCLEKISKYTAFSMHYSHMFTLIVVQIGHLSIHPTLPTLIWVIITTLFSSFHILENRVLEISKLCLELVRNIGSSKKLSEDDSDSTNSLVAKIVGALYVCIGTITGIKTQSTISDKLSCSKLFSIFAQNSKGITNVTNAIKQILDVISYMFDRIYRWAADCTYLQRWFWSSPGSVKLYLQLAQKYAHPDQEEIIMTTIQGYSDIDSACEMGSQLLRDANYGKPSNINIILDAQRRLLALRDKAARMGRGVSRRRDPFCIHITGAPGIGKSQLTTPVVTALLEAEKFAYSGNVCWSYKAGMKHWDGYFTQPCIVYDELAPMNDSQAEVEEISTFQYLKSSAPFIMPGAALEDKGRCAHPEIIWLNSNIPYPNIQCSRVVEAIWRRYDTLWQVEFTPRAKELVGDYNSDNAIKILKEHKLDVDNFEHLQFRRKVRPDKQHDRTYEDPVSIQEFLNKVAVSFRAHRKNQFHLQELFIKNKFNVQYPDDIAEIPKAVHDRNIILVDKSIATCEEEIADTLDNSTPLSNGQTARSIHTSNFRKNYMGRGHTLYRLCMEKVKETEMESSTQSPILARCAMSQMSANDLCEYLRNQGLCVAPPSAYRDDHIRPKFGPLRVTTERVIDPPCLHTFDNLKSSTWDHNTKEFILADTVRLPKRCRSNCNIEAHAAKLAKYWSTNSKYWSLTLSIEPDIIPYDDPLSDYNINKYLKTLESEKPASYDRWSLFKTFLKYCGAIFVVSSAIMVPAAVYDGYLENRRYQNNVNLINLANKYKEQKQYVSEVSPAAYSGTKGLTNNRRAIIRRSLVAATAKDEEVDVTVDYPVSICNFKFTESDNDVFINLILNNTRFMMFSGFDQCGVPKRVRGRVLGICDRFILFPKHYISEWNLMRPVDRTIIVYHLGIDISMTDLDLNSLWYLERSDLCVYKLPLKFPLFKDIRKHLSTYESIEAGLSKNCVFYEVQCNVDSAKGQVMTVNDIKTEFGPEQMIRSVDGDYLVKESIVYGGVHGKGKCGSVIVDPAKKKIVGMHVAGGRGEGMSLIVVREPFDELMNEEVTLSPLTPEDYYPDYVDPELSPKIQLEGTFLEGGVVVKEVEHRETGKTAYEPSEIHGFLPVLTAPDILSPKDPRAQGFSPMKLGCEKHGQPITKLPLADVELALQDYRNLVISKVTPIINNVEPLTVTEAIMGNKEKYPGLKAMEMNTSEGYPFLKDRPKGATNKSWLFNFTYDNEGRKVLSGIHKDLDETLRDKLSLRAQGQVPPTIFTDCLKDARKPIDKIIPGKTRIFSISPVDFTIQCRQYFAPFFQAFEQAGFAVEHAIGIAVQRDDWSVLVNQMRRFAGDGGKYACGDYKAFGDTLAAELVSGSMDIAIDWMYKYERKHLPYEECEKNKLIRQCMREELKNAYHLSFNLIYQTLCGMPSGCPLTVYLNTMVNSLYIRIAWRKIFENCPELRHFDKMYSYIRFVTYGDDIWIALKKEILDLFNNQILHKTFEEMGVKYHDILKGNEMRMYCELHEVDFLKNKIKIHPHRTNKFLAALDPISIEDCANWVHKSSDKRAASLETSAAALTLAYGHGPAYYNDFKQKLINAWAEKDVHFVGRQWQDWDDLFYEEDIPPVFMANYPIESTPVADRAVIYARAREAYRKYKLMSVTNP